MRGVIASNIVGLAAVLCAGTAARADDVEAAAQVHLDRGVAAYGAAEWELARKEFRATVELVPHKPNPYRWLALVEIQLGECAHARLDIDSFIARVDAADPRIPELVRARDNCKQRGVPQVVLRDEPVVTGTRPVVREESSIATKWWFWTAIGVTAVAITGAVFFAASGDDPIELPSVSCTASGCR